MTEPGSGASPSGQHGTPDGWTAPLHGAPAGTADAGWAPQQEAPAVPEKKGLKKWLPVAGSVVVAGVVGVSGLGLFGFGDPEVGDCVQMTSDTDFEVVDCGSAEAEYKIAGIQAEEMTWPEFEKAPEDEVCTDFATWEVALWIGEETQPGTVYCSVAA